ncbi:hypothetical protein [Geomonas sp.]|uniref:hypothetical protein n=1 Tax=Geomonas sp. TaxID=2651584 RepID=UPI002B46D3EB|nr:hypothetical protein [Geomonas sp.]HJV33595.1 hypothetical protein [Geomonas sp.]
MNEYNLINRCLSTLKSSKMDVMSKLRMESLLIGIKMLMLVDIAGQDSTPDLEELLLHVKEVCTGESADGVNGLLEHVRKLQSSMVSCLDLSC